MTTGERAATHRTAEGLGIGDDNARTLTYSCCDERAVRAEGAAEPSQRFTEVMPIGVSGEGRESSRDTEDSERSIGAEWPSLAQSGRDEGGFSA